MKRIFLALGCLALSLSACATLPVPTSGAPPQLPSAWTAAARTSLDAIGNTFDAALYGVDLAMDAHLLTPGSAKAKEIAAIGRKVQTFLNAADAALRAGNATSYQEALDNANAAISQFKVLLPHTSTTGMAAPPRLSPQARASLLQRLA